jgi:hypothetical protein
MVRAPVGSVVWSFRRGQESLSLHTEFDAGRAEFVLRWRYADGREDVERYTNQFTFRGRLLALEEDLREWGWSQLEPAEFLRDGWRVK